MCGDGQLIKVGVFHEKVCKITASNSHREAAYHSFQPHMMPRKILTESSTNDGDNTSHCVGHSRVCYKCQLFCLSTRTMLQFENITSITVIDKSYNIGQFNLCQLRYFH